VNDLSWLELDNGWRPLYSFDWDGNALIMPTKHYYQEVASGKIIEVPGSQIDQDPWDFMWEDGIFLWEGCRYKYVEWNKTISYREYRDTFFGDLEKYSHRWVQWFLDDVKVAAENPDMHTYVTRVFVDECLMNGRFFAINTARWHSQETLMAWVKLMTEILIDTQAKRKEFIDRLRSNYNLWEDMSDHQVFEYYFGYIWSYVPWDNIQAKKTIPLHANSRYDRKTEAHTWIIRQTIDKYYRLSGDNSDEIFSRNNPLAVWFSDDSPSSVKAVWWLMSTQESIDDIPLRQRLFYTWPEKWIASVKSEFQNVLWKQRIIEKEWGQWLEVRFH